MCALSQVGNRPNMTLDVARTQNNKQQLYWMGQVHRDSCKYMTGFELRVGRVDKRALPIKSLNVQFMRLCLNINACYMTTLLCLDTNKSDMISFTCFVL